MPIQQSGSVTPGHLVKWTTDNVVQDGGAPNINEQVLAYANVSMADTSDQPLTLPSTINVFCITRIIMTNASTSLTTCVGGFYPVASKGGTPIVAASQTYSALTAASKLMNPTLASYGSTTRFDNSILTSSWAIYFALTTGQGVASTCDCYVVGIDLTVRSGS